MRKSALILITLTILMLYGCKSTGETELSSVQNTNTSAINASDTENAEIERDKNTEEAPSEIQAETVIYTEVSQGGPYGKISISLPDGWSYEACPIDSDDLMYGMYGIHFYPESATDGYIELVYVDWFGVCGTGLASETAVIAGNTADIGTYDGHEYWGHIAFRGEYEGIVALTYSVDQWWSENSDQVMDILDTLSFDQNMREGGAYLYDEESDINEIGLYFTLKNISSTGAVLVFNQYDAEAVTGELTYGDDYVLETKKNGEWESVPVIVEGNYGFHAIAYTITAGEKTESEIDWKWLYGELKPGEYRIGKSVNDFRKSGDYDSYTVYAHFQICCRSEGGKADVSV